MNKQLLSWIMFLSIFVFGLLFGLFISFEIVPAGSPAIFVLLGLFVLSVPVSVIGGIMVVKQMREENKIEVRANEGKPIPAWKSDQIAGRIYKRRLYLSGLIPVLLFILTLFIGDMSSLYFFYGYLLSLILLLPITIFSLAKQKKYTWLFLLLGCNILLGFLAIVLSSHFSGDFLLKNLSWIVLIGDVELWYYLERRGEVKI